VSSFTDAAREVVAKDVQQLGYRCVARMLACEHTTVARWLSGQSGHVSSDLLDAVVAVYGLPQIGAELRRANRRRAGRVLDHMTVPDSKPSGRESSVAAVTRHGQLSAA
jgi:hypothetical protein